MKKTPAPKLLQHAQHVIAVYGDKAVLIDPTTQQTAVYPTQRQAKWWASIRAHVERDLGRELSSYVTCQTYINRHKEQ